MNLDEPQALRVQKLFPMFLRSLLRPKQRHHCEIHCRDLGMAACRGDDILIQQERAVSLGHCGHNVAENLTRILIWPVVQDGAEVIDAGAVDPLRREEVVRLTFNAL